MKILSTPQTEMPPIFTFVLSAGKRSQQKLGIFDTPEEAALCIARRLGYAKSRALREVFDSGRGLQWGAAGAPIRSRKPVAAHLAVAALGVVKVHLKVRAP